MVFEEGRNCWRYLRTDQVGFLIDGEAYFSAVASALMEAQKTVFILAWDIHSSTAMKVPGTDRKITLAELLVEISKKRPHLRIFILAWDFFSPLYTFERELLQRVRFGLLRKKRIHFVFDHHHPLIGCQHQKIVVVDDRIAFCGGLDLTVHRWDTPEHDPLSPVRVLPDGKKYPPFHDVQLAVSGQGAVELGALARTRWRTATNVDVPPSPPTETKDISTYVPKELLLRDVQIAISRTYPLYKTQKECREVEQLYFDMIAFAERFIYIENQYFTCLKIAEALAKSLAQEAGPEVVVVLPRDPGGWLEESTIGSRQARTLRLLIDSDKHKRLRVLFPDDDRLPKDNHKTVHAKVMICDGVLARVGSANLNNRSMGLDAECDIAIDGSKDGVTQKVLRNFLASLLVDHTGADLSLAHNLVANPNMSLLQTVERLNGEHPHKRLQKIKIPSELATVVTVQDVDLMDMEQPIPIEKKIDDWGYLHERIRRRFGVFDIRTSFWVTVAFALLIALFFAYPSVSRIVKDNGLLQMSDNPYAPINLVGIALLFGLATLFFIPINLVILAVVSLYPTLAALGYILFGTAIGAASGYACGFLLRTKLVRSFIGKRSKKVLDRVGEGRLWALILIRILPVAPNSLINYVAGMSRIKFGKFLLGTLIGIMPGTLVLTFLQKSLLDFITTRNSYSLIGAIFVIIFVVLLYRAVRHRFSRYVHPLEE
jgi:phospholipase D1/2